MKTGMEREMAQSALSGVEQMTKPLSSAHNIQIPTYGERWATKIANPADVQICRESEEIEAEKQAQLTGSIDGSKLGEVTGAAVVYHRSWIIIFDFS